MGIARSTMIGVIGLVAGTIFGALVWYALGRSYDNYSAAVIIPCNVLPLAGLLGGAVLGWKSARE